MSQLTKMELLSRSKLIPKRSLRAALQDVGNTQRESLRNDSKKNKVKEQRKVRTKSRAMKFLRTW